MKTPKQLIKVIQDRMLEELTEQEKNIAIQCYEMAIVDMKKEEVEYEHSGYPTAKMQGERVE
jgi:CTP:phosphocholine cytidylyltransferase-like protein